MIIYVITQGEYSDYHICAVTDDAEKAELLRQRFSDKYDIADIEEYDTEDVEISGMATAKYCFRCEWTDDGITVDDGSTDFENAFRYVKYNPLGKTLIAYVYANTKDEALKKAADKFAKYRAEHFKL